MMKPGAATDLMCATLAGFVGAGTALLLLYGPSLSPEEKTVVRAHEFILLNQKNQPVGRFTASPRDGLPYITLEGLDREGILFKDGAVFIGFHERIPQIRVHGTVRKSGVVQAVGDNEGGLSILGERGKQVITFKASQGKVWEQMLEDRSP